MSAIGRVRRARSALALTLAGAALLWAAVAFAGVLLLIVVADLAAPIALGVRRLAAPAAAAGAAAAAAVVLWRGRHASTLSRVALYLEERVPALQFALVTAIESAGTPAMPALEQVVDRVDPRGALRGPIRRALAVPVAALAPMLVALAVVPRGTLERVVRPAAGDVLLRPHPAATRASRLSPIAARVVPPAYARQAPHTLEDPSSVAALVGSAVQVRGRGAARGGEAQGGIGARLGDRAQRLEVRGDTWAVTLAMPSQPAVLRLADGRFQRLLTLEPRRDEPPAVTLTLPAGDTVLPAPRGRFTLAAVAEDDIGLAVAELELIHTSGSGERFSMRRWTVGTVRTGGARRATLAAVLRLDTLRFDTLRLAPGDVLHVRAVARDRNDVTGPGEGASDTRTIRILDPRQHDSVAVYPAAAAPLDTATLSQRMLILRAETLLLRRRAFAADSLARSSQRLGALQGALRGRVESVIAEVEGEEGAEFVGPTAVSALLRRAATAMLDAETELYATRVAASLPHMRLALGLLEQARDLTRRYWLRGVLPKVPVDLGRVRLTGTDRAAVASRAGRPRADDPRRSLLARLGRAQRLLAGAPEVAADSLTMIRVDALSRAPEVADPLGRAIAALLEGRDPAAELLRARRRLERATVAVPGLSAWQGAR